MADNLNPFLEEMDEDDFIEDELENRPIPDVIDTALEQEPEQPPVPTGISMDLVAAKLLKDNFILTALELHTELVESGREMPRLRDFFSNPSNFERLKPPESSPPGLPRTSSCQTFDSLDFARYSDDGDRQENDKVAVLEFELRKAQETIKSLRATLTKTAETELSTPESPADQLEDFNQQGHMKEYEKRALNFLVNEYMLTNNYKLTSVTFAEENEDQDFEDWDDVGLNMPKPPSLLPLYRDFAQHTAPIIDKSDFNCGVDFDEQVIRDKEQQLEVVRMELTLKMGELEEQIAVMTKDNAFLTSQLKHMEREIEVNRFNRMSSSTPVCSPIKAGPTSDTARQNEAPTAQSSDPQAKRQNDTPDGISTASLDANGEVSEESDIKELEDDDNEDEEAQKEDRESDSDVLGEKSPPENNTPPANGEQTTEEELDVEQTETETNTTGVKSTDGDATQYTTVLEPDMTSEPNSLAVEVGTILQTPNVTVESSVLQNKTADNITTSDNKQSGNNITPGLAKFQWQPCQRKMSEAFQKALLNTAFHVSQDSRIVNEVTKITDSSGENVVLMLGRCLPHIVPNVLLAKREELIPVIVCTASLHPDSEERDRLLNILFNLIKRPDLDQRQMILMGCVAFAQHVGATRVETELLPQCWEQINHRFAERRLLVAEACGSLAPYLPNEIRSSLVLSMLVQMLQYDKLEEVRESVVRALGLLIGFVDDIDRYPKVSELLLTSLNDTSDRVVRVTQNIFLPSFAMWASELGRLETDLIHSFVAKLESLVHTAQSAPGSGTVVPSMGDRARFVLLTETLTKLIPALFASVLKTAPFADKPNTATEDQSYEVLMTRFPKPPSELMNLATILGAPQDVVQLVHRYEEYIGEEWYEPWETYIWVAGEFIPQLLNILNAVDVTSPTIVSSMSKFFLSICRTFGRTFAMSKVKPKFHSVLNIPEEHLDGAVAGPTDRAGAPYPFLVTEAQVASGQTALTKCTVPVYVAGILGAFNQEGDRQALTTFLQDLLCTLSLCHAPLDSLRAAFTELSSDSDYHDLLLTVLWDGVVHTSAHVRTTAAKMFALLIKGVSETLVSTRVIPALVTLASDPEISVRIATIPAFGIIMESVTQREMLDKVHMQFMTFMDDPMYKDQHALHVELIRTFAKVGPNAEPRFRDDFVLPRLAIISTQNQHNGNDTRRLDIATQLFDAYSALSCCFIGDQLIQESMLPGLRALHGEMTALAPDHAPIVASMIKEFEDKIDTTRVPAESPKLPALKETKTAGRSPKISLKFAESNKPSSTKPSKKSPSTPERGGGTPSNSPSPGVKHGTDDVRSMLTKFKGNHPKFTNIFKKS